MKPARRACSRCALLLLPLVAAGCADSLLRNGDAAVDQREVVERATMQQARYERIIAPGESPKKLADGFTFTEGPTWL
jgi:hypothetical protein